jgi:hypothetical protein
VSDVANGRGARGAAEQPDARPTLEWRCDESACISREVAHPESPSELRFWAPCGGFSPSPRSSSDYFAQCHRLVLAGHPLDETAAVVVRLSSDHVMSAETRRHPSLTAGRPRTRRLRRLADGVKPATLGGYPEGL